MTISFENSSLDNPPATAIAEELDVRALLARGEEPFQAIMSAATRVPAEADTGVVRLDVSDLVPPEPMVRILEAAAQLRADQTLFVEHHRRPVYLYPQLDAQGFVHETREIGPGRVHILIRRRESNGA